MTRIEDELRDQVETLRLELALYQEDMLSLLPAGTPAPGSSARCVIAIRERQRRELEQARGKRTCRSCLIDDFNRFNDALTSASRISADHLKR